MTTSSDATDPAVKKLREYQRTGIKFLSERKAALLADEMGLGKTVQTILAIRILLRSPDADRVLIVTPAATRLNWEREFGTWAPELIVRRVIGNQKDRWATYTLPIPIIIASYEQIRTDYLMMRPDEPFGLVVADEVQRVKNRHSETALACRTLPRRRTWALSGTPLENSTEDLVSVWGFVKEDVVSKGVTKAQLHAAVQPYFLRRTKEDVLKELPPMIYQDLRLELGPAQRATYDDLWYSRRDFLTRHASNRIIGALALITRLKQICNRDPKTDESAKLDELGVIIENLNESTDKMIVFSQYVETLTWLSKRLSIASDLYHGGLSEAERDTVIGRWKCQSGPRALLVSLRAGGVGINLQEAKTIVLFDRWWNPAVEMQAVQRAHRFGRDVPLHVVRFITNDTIEERIEDILEDKHILFERLIEEAPQRSVKPYTPDQLYNLLQIDPSLVRYEAT